jgi:hypothetical protein
VTAALVVLAVAFTVSTLVWGLLARWLLLEQRRYVAALLAPTPQAVQRILDPPKPKREPPAEPVRTTEPIGA